MRFKLTFYLNTHIPPGLFYPNYIWNNDNNSSDDGVVALLVVVVKSNNTI